LKKNNSRDWFQRHKEEYTKEVLEPAKALVLDLGKHLQTISPHIIAVPQINRSIFRIYRDTRFGPDKTPYKTYLALFFWEGVKPRMECPGFYFQLAPSRLMLGGGLYRFPRPILSQYRASVVDAEYGSELAQVIEKISGLEGYTLGGRHYKRLPSGFDSQHPNAELLLYNGLYAGIEGPIPEELYSPALIEFCFEKFRPLKDLHGWLVGLSSRHLF